MRLLLSVLLALVAVTLVAGPKLPPDKKPLLGWLVVLDPGHGGQDPGSSGRFNDQRVVEDEYVYDVALRVNRILRSMGALSFLTVQDRKTGERSLKPQEIFPDERQEAYTGTSSVVRSGTWGLNQRLAYGNTLSRTYPRHRQAWISIHFDVLGKNKVIEGVRVIAPKGSDKLAQALARSFAQYHRLRKNAPIIRNGDKTYGLRNLFILNGGNRISEKALIELGNFNNTTDVWRVRNPVTREAYARAIAEALLGW